jgi:hypothetical protein
VAHADSPGIPTGAEVFAAFASVTRTLTQRGQSPVDGRLNIFRSSPLPPENR